MKFKKVLDSLEGLDDAVKKLYVEKDGKFYLDVEGDDYAELRETIEKERKAARDAQKLLKKLEGVDPEKYQELLDAEEKRKLEGIEKRGEWDKLKVQLVEKHAKDLVDKDAIISTMKNAVEKHIVSAAVSQAVAESKGSAKVLFPHVKAMVRAVEKDGEYHVEVVDTDGTTRLGGSDAKNMTVAQLVDEFKQDKDFAGAWPASVGGKAPGSSGTGDLNNEEFLKLPPAERLKISRRQLLNTEKMEG
jgi:hypothetical protein